MTYDAVVCGAGIAGVASAYALVHDAGMRRVAIVDHGPPLGLTSDKSTECYRNWWPGPGNAMIALMDRSISLMETHARASGNRFHLNRRGYLFATADPARVDEFEARALEAAELGAGPLRYHGPRPGSNRAGNSPYEPASAEGFDSPFHPTIDGADLITDRALITRHFPYLSSDTVSVLHARRCGALSAQQLGMYLLEGARDGGAELIPAALVGMETSAGKLSGVQIRDQTGERRLATEALVLAPGPYLKSVAALLGLELPVTLEKHIKISVSDPHLVIPRSAPLIIWNDPISLPWSAEERELLHQCAETRGLLEEFPAGVHGRPVGAGDQVLMYWTYECETTEAPEFPLTWNPFLPEITLRGMAVMVPGLRRYFDPMPKPYVDGGYYAKTPENRPLIGPLPVPGTYVCAAFSGFGIMAACASGELIASHIGGGALPAYAHAFAPSRYQDPIYCEMLDNWDASGQL